MIILVCMVAAVSLARTAGAQDRKRVDIHWNDAPQITPFDGVRWKGNVPEVHVAGDWYGLVSFDDLPAELILDFSKSADDKDWKKRFDEDLMAILTAMGHTPGKTADLKLKDLQTGEVRTLEKVPMTEDNRRTLMEGHPNDKDDSPAQTQPAETRPSV